MYFSKKIRLFVAEPFDGPISSLISMPGPDFHGRAHRPLSPPLTRRTHGFSSHPWVLSPWTATMNCVGQTIAAWYFWSLTRRHFELADRHQLILRFQSQGNGFLGLLAGAETAG